MPEQKNSGVSHPLSSSGSYNLTWSGYYWNSCDGSAVNLLSDLTSRRGIFGTLGKRKGISTPQASSRFPTYNHTSSTSQPLEL